jgi:hypothetical protein
MEENNAICVEPNILDLPYSEKRLIVCVPDEVKKVEIEAIKNKNISEKDNGKNTSWADVAIPAVAAMVARRLSPYIMGVEFVLGIYNGIKKLIQKEIEIVTISNSQANNLIFPPGHPQKGCVYVCNPVQPKAYFPLAEFHRMMLESKFSEIISILMSLGAESISVERIIGINSEITIECDAKTVTKDSVGCSISQTKNQDKSFIFDAKLKPKNKPKLPNKLVWYEFEPTWQVITNGRMECGLQKFMLNVTYLENYGITADLNSSIKGNGLSVGGEFKEHQSTIWKVSGEFATLDVSES